MKTAEKKSLRKRVRKQIRLISKTGQQTKSRQICQHLEHLSFFTTGAPVLTFSPLPDEVDLSYLFHKRRNLQTFCFPRVSGQKLEIRQVREESELIPGYANILEPSPDQCPLLPAQDLKIILLPGLAFDPATGARLGKGKGFYDRLIQDLRETRTTPILSLRTVGVCFDCQLTQVPEEPHDQRLDAIVTESGLLTSCE